MNLQEIYKQQRKEYETDIEQVLSATDYTDSYIKHGNQCDSGYRCDIRMEFIKKAEKIFIDSNKKDILKLAAEMIKDYIREK